MSSFTGIPQVSISAFLQALSRPDRGRPIRQQHPELHANVRSIIDQVRHGGHSALKTLQAKYDPQVQHLDAYPTKPLIEPLCPKIQAALDHAYRNLLHVHQAQYPNDLHTEPQPGLSVSQHFRPIQRVGLYVPGGSAPLVSTVLMLGVPAKVAGCHQRVLCSPAVPSSAMQYAGDLCGIEHIYAFGGAQAIAAMAYGTEGVPKVDKVFGPGNAYVTEAKRQVSQDPLGAAMDLPAGPSELMLVVDQQANPEWVAADLLSQGEHGADSQLVLVSFDQSQLARIEQTLKQQLVGFPRRSLAEHSLANSYQLRVSTMDEALRLINAYAPEHLILNVAEPERFVQGIEHAGTVFLGRWTPEALGDYASGSNHVLPTYGYAKYHSGLSTRDFMKSISVQQATPAALQSMAATVTKLARLEHLEGHARAIDQRVTGQGAIDQPVMDKHAVDVYAIDACTIDKYLDKHLDKQGISQNDKNNSNLIPKMAFINPKWHDFAGYQSASDQNNDNYSAAGEKSSHHPGLNANELPKPWVQLPNSSKASSINRYPRPSTHIQQLYARYAGVTPEHCLVCRGADEGIELLIRACCRPQDRIMTLAPTYGMYAISAELQGIGCLDLPITLPKLGVTQPHSLKPESALTLLDLESLAFDSLDSDSLDFTPVRLFFLCNPNNPTGQVVDLATITRLLELLGPNRLLVVDEAYIEFAEIASAVELLDQYPNLAILRTLSKAFGLAGLRLGFVLAQPQMIALLRRLQAPYPICSLVEPWVDAAFAPESTTARLQAIDDIKERRQQFLRDCQSLVGVQVHPSQGNFVLLTARSSTQIANLDARTPHLTTQKVSSSALIRRIMDACATDTLAVRAVNDPFQPQVVNNQQPQQPQQPPQALRISIGTASEMQQLTRILIGVCGKTSSCKSDSYKSLSRKTSLGKDHSKKQPALESDL